ncbi:hypothetical protein [Flammeovirga aprica]|uniref:Uncharacterized protein n=1 Tax=Flammeovirga aprica JL-4 TaxID=694437 RepID=A0A7X9S0A3_9BACT|nr:hypothetical protein [Flammeovirga aprica]NME72077.1 hypothetical protein [Flammeovirga aprica JL-4]
MKLKITFNLIFLILPFISTAQGLKNKDHVIEQFMLNPRDTVMWECYMGKSWNAMNIFEKEQCVELSKRYSENLKKKLTEQKISFDEIKTRSFDSEVDSIEALATKILTNDLLKEEKELEQTAKLAAEASVAELKSLSQNTKKNLLLIEEILKSKTSELNIEYQGINSENGEEVLSWIKMYGQKIYTETYKQIIDSNAPQRE